MMSCICYTLTNLAMKGTQTIDILSWQASHCLKDKPITCPSRLRAFRIGISPTLNQSLSHLTEIRAKKGLWRKTPEAVRQAVIEELIGVIANAPNQGRLLYAAAVEKNATLWSERAVEAATEQICQRFDNF